VQKIMAEEKLTAHISSSIGPALESGLRARLSSHPHVGDIRGRGLFWGLEIVQDKSTKEPFPLADGVAMQLHSLGLQKYDISIYPSTGSADGVKGDHIIISPAYNITLEDVNEIVDRVGKIFEEVFAEGTGKGFSGVRIY
jgi:adenosylmethionine-8-amino-7-oxononanoate aminotransferase